MHHRFHIDHSCQDNRGDYLGEVKKEDMDDKECRAVIDALNCVADIDEIDIVNLSVGSSVKIRGLEEVLQKLDNKVLMAAAGETLSAF